MTVSLLTNLQKLDYLILRGCIFSEYILKSFIDKKENVTDSYKPLFAKVSEVILFLYSSKLNILFFNE